MAIFAAVASDGCDRCSRAEGALRPRVKNNKAGTVNAMHEINLQRDICALIFASNLHSLRQALLNMCIWYVKGSWLINYGMTPEATVGKYPKTFEVPGRSADLIGICLF